MVRRWSKSLLAIVLVIAVVVAGWTPPAAAEPTARLLPRPTEPAGEVLKSVDVVPVTPADQSTPAVAEVSAPTVVWPAADQTRTGRITVKAGEPAVEVPDTGLRVSTPAAAARTGGADDETGGRAAEVQVRAVDRATVERLAGAGVGYLIDGVPDSKVTLDLDYAPFADAVGADWGGRLRWFAAPACLLDTPEAPECQQVTWVESVNDVAGRSLTGEVTLAGGSVVVMAAGAPTGAGGDFTATGLSSSSSWSAGGSSGEFSWSYPLRTPPVAGGLGPDVGVGYSSAEADGRTSGGNNQPSWLGEGFDLNVGFIERRYVGCGDEVGTSGANNATKTGDLCWLTDPVRTNDAKWDNATLSLAGHSGELVRVANTAVWRLKDDDGTRVEKLGVAGAASGEHWKVTTTDGTQYFFGKGSSDGLPGTPTNSMWSVPVAGNHAGEPAYNAAFGSSFRSVPWRWNLDYVVTPDGDSMTYAYVAESNKYRRNLTTTVSYTRGGYLSEIRYGESRGSETLTPGAKVTFTVAERCFNDAALPDCAAATPTTTNAYHWPDVPVDSICTGTTCAVGQVSPTFFTRKRLSQVDTFVRNTSSTFDAVDRWAFAASYPDSGDGSPNALWLSTIVHTGLVGTAISLPAVSFTPTMMVNRVTGLNYGTPLTRARLTTITLESGGKINVGYQASDCTAGSLPTPSTNGKRCFPAFYSDGGPPILQWFNKYVVTTVLEQDTAQVVNPNDQVSGSGAVAKRTSYTYVGAPAWRYNDSLLTPVKYRTWSIWRGFGEVVTAVGDSGATQTVTRSLFFRGMHGDKTDTSATKNVSITDSQGGTWADEDHFAGVLRESRQLTAVSDGSVLGGTIFDPYVSAPTADDGRVKARVVDTAETRTRQTVTGNPVRTSKTINKERDTSYPWLVTQVENTGDQAVTGDETCERMSYASNATAWLIGFPAETSVMPNLCATPLADATALQRSRTFYDGSTTVGAAPTRGLATRVDQLTGSTSRVWKTMTTTVYDGFGRPTSTTNALGQTSTTAYAPATGRMVTTITETSPDPDGAGAGVPLVTTTTLDPRWGIPTKRVAAGGQTSEATLDALGRVTAVWVPGRAKTLGASMKYTYGVNVGSTGVNWVKTESLRADGTYAVAYTVSDSLLRPRQTQTQAANGTTGRVIADQRYDSRGLPTFASTYTTTIGTPDGKLVQPVQLVDIPAVTETTYDAAERPLVSLLREYGYEKLRTTSVYTGAQVKVTPPVGGTPTTTSIDLHGRTTALTEHLGATTDATGVTTSYTYTAAGLLKSMTDPQGNVWSYTYDMAGNQLTASDPDKGTTTSTYDLLGNVTATTDARGQGVKTVYDQVNRPIKTTDLANATLTTSVWDTVKPGLLTSSARQVGAAQIVSKVNSYDTAGRPTSSSMVVPTITNLIPSQLAGTYTTTQSYNIDGSAKTVGLPAAGPVPAETLTIGYDARSNLFSLTGVSGSTTTNYVTDAYYTPLGEPDTVWFGLTGGGWLGRQTYYEASTRRLTTMNTIMDTVGNVELGTIGYDLAGNIVKTTSQQATTTDTQCYRYSPRRQLTTAWTPTDGACGTNPTQAGLGGPSPYWKTWTTNDAGLITQRVDRTKTASTTTTFAHAAAGQPRPHFTTSATSTGSTPETRTYAADAAGNTTSRTQAGQTQTLAWDTENKLDTVTVGGTLQQKNVYDAGGNRILRREAGKTTLYSPAGEITVTHSTSAVTNNRYYTFGGSVIALRTGNTLNTVTYLMADHQDTTHLQINAQTRATSTKWSAPYGMTRTTTGSWAGERAFVGGTTDAAIGLTHIGAREYDTHLNRFISVDPILEISDPVSHNAYTYANNNPVTFSDPTGLRMLADGLYTPWARTPAPGSTAAANTASPTDASPSKNISTPKNTSKAASSNTKKLPTINKAQREVIGWIAGFVAEVVITAGVCAITAGVGCLAGRAVAGFVGYSIDALINERWNPQDAAMATAMALIPIPGIGGAVTRPTAQRLAPAGANAVKTAIQQTGGAATRAGTTTTATTTTKAATRTPVTAARACSFVGTTAVLMADGTKKPIEDIDVGDLVIATDPETGEQAAKAVEHVFVHDDTVIDLLVDGEVITTTDDHPFWSVTDQRFERADHLATGEQVLRANGTTATIAELDDTTTRRAVAYNLSIEHIHTYHVGNNEILVHNMCNMAKGSAPEIKAGASGGDSAGQAFPNSVKAEALDENLSVTGGSTPVCAWCRMPTSNHHTDHAHPRSLGGDATLANAQVACPHCNMSRGNRASPLTPPDGYRGAWPPPWWPGQ